MVNSESRLSKACRDADRIVGMVNGELTPSSFCPEFISGSFQNLTFVIPKSQDHFEILG